MTNDHLREAVPVELRRWFDRQLLAWFRKHRRDLPWRASRDPYTIWVSEVMLQQTQVATVVPYFRRFLTTFPTVADLAAADEQQVLRLWEGLGYYRRARDLHRGARWLAEHHQARLPDDPEVLARVPGVGRYTLGAILSQAYDRRLPILEANSERVLCRFFAHQGDPRGGLLRRLLWRQAEALLPARHAGAFNQALMELGALVCTASAPACGACPLRTRCAARRLGLQEQLPRKAPPPAPVDVEEVAVVVRRNGQVLLTQRPDRGRWAGLWEFPHGPLEEGETHEQAAGRLLARLTGVSAEPGPELLTVRHGVMHYRISLVCLEARYRKGQFRSDFYQEGRWLRPVELQAYPVSSPQRKLARALLGDRQPRLF